MSRSPSCVIGTHSDRSSSAARCRGRLQIQAGRPSGSTRPHSRSDRPRLVAAVSALKRSCRPDAREVLRGRILLHSTRPCGEDARNTPSRVLRQRSRRDTTIRPPINAHGRAERCRSMTMSPQARSPRRKAPRQRPIRASHEPSLVAVALHSRAASVRTRTRRRSLTTFLQLGQLSLFGQSCGQRDCAIFADLRHLPASSRHRGP